MPTTRDTEADAVRRRYIEVFGGSLDEARACPLEDLRRLVAIADGQAELYRSMGFDLPDDGPPARPTA